MERKETRFRMLGNSKAQLLPKEMEAKSQAWAMHSMPPDLSAQSHVLLTKSISSLRQGKVTNQIWVVPVKSRRRQGQRQVGRQVPPWFGGLYPEQLLTVQILSSAPYSADAELLLLQEQDQKLALLRTQVRQLS